MENELFIFIFLYKYLGINEVLIVYKKKLYF